MGKLFDCCMMVWLVFGIGFLIGGLACWRMAAKAIRGVGTGTYTGASSGEELRGFRIGSIVASCIGFTIVAAWLIVKLWPTR